MFPVHDQKGATNGNGNNHGLFQAYHAVFCASQ